MFRRRVRCPVCGKPIKSSEKAQIKDVKAHQSCFKCKICGVKLSPKTYHFEDSSFYCEEHFKKYCEEKDQKSRKVGFFSVEEKQDTEEKKRTKPQETETRRKPEKEDAETSGVQIDSRRKIGGEKKIKTHEAIDTEIRYPMRDRKKLETKSKTRGKDKGDSLRRDSSHDQDTGDSEKPKPQISRLRSQKSGRSLTRPMKSVAMIGRSPMISRKSPQAEMKEDDRVMGKKEMRKKLKEQKHSKNLKENSKENSKENLKENSKETSKENLKEISKENSKENVDVSEEKNDDQEKQQKRRLNLKINTKTLVSRGRKADTNKAILSGAVTPRRIQNKPLGKNSNKLNPNKDLQSPTKKKSKKPKKSQKHAVGDENLGVKKTRRPRYTAGTLGRRQTMMPVKRITKRHNLKAENDSKSQNKETEKAMPAVSSTIISDNMRLSQSIDALLGQNTRIKREDHELVEEIQLRSKTNEKKNLELIEKQKEIASLEQELEQGPVDDQGAFESAEKLTVILIGELEKARLEAEKLAEQKKQLLEQAQMNIDLLNKNTKLTSQIEDLFRQNTDLTSEKERLNNGGFLRDLESVQKELFEKNRIIIDENEREIEKLEKAKKKNKILEEVNKVAKKKISDLEKQLGIDNFEDEDDEWIEDDFK
ncbi:lim zinc finger domain containing protein [Anaeramoeba ignava]|uniref:Lim zinc finger domain containing protein n=1 Tax=Anaeramoeba ignava TaxID=1746090 RepID=A0A9Q0LLV8_ANAIG|nr:lim zinc finger domain containing protein [Anaeramoeba ignava]